MCLHFIFKPQHVKLSAVFCSPRTMVQVRFTFSSHPSSVNFLHFDLLLKNHWAKLDQTNMWLVFFKNVVLGTCFSSKISAMASHCLKNWKFVYIFFGHIRLVQIVLEWFPFKNVSIGIVL